MTTDAPIARTALGDLRGAFHDGVATFRGVPFAAPPVRSDADPVSDESKVCRSPFAGTVSRISAQVGQSIQVNDVLLVLEAMKMDTVITSPIAGKVAKINVNAGDAVQQGQVLVEFA